MRRSLLVLALFAACRPGPTDLPSVCAVEGEACFEYGLTYQFPETGAPDLSRALAVYDRACALGEARACVQAANVLHFGVTPRDEARVAELARRACALKLEDACTRPPSELGVMPKDAIRAVVRAHIGEVRACYEAGLARNPDLRGRVVLTFTIAPDGAVTDVVAVDELSDALPVARCCVDAARAWRFPSPFGRVVVAYPFDLSADGSKDP